MKAHFKEIPFDQYTPIAAYHALATPGSCILESSPKKDRYSFVGVDPFAACSGQGDYVEALRAFRRPVEIDHPLALYVGGPIGYVAFEGDYFFQLYRSGVVFDHALCQAFLFTLGAAEELDRLEQKLRESQPMPAACLAIGPIAVDLSDEEFCAKVERAKEHLRAGDVFQIVLSRTFTASFQGDPFQFYRKLRKTSPAPYLFFFQFDTFAVAGASPEKVISVQGDQIESAPLAGTRPKNSQRPLLTDPKECAEHVMLVDLARNDVGAVSLPGTVRVAEFKALCESSHVDHIVSRIVGTLDPQFDALDAFRASFPAGTLSGAPKKRAMELIGEIEQNLRGLYGGAIVALDAKGQLASCIAIRTALLKDGMLSVRSGAGIVLDSDPAREAEETRFKASTVLEVAHDCHRR